MNVINFSVLLFFVTFYNFSQTKDNDAYFILDEKDIEYKLIITKYKSEIIMFSIYNRKQFEEREKLIEKDKKKGTYNELNEYNKPHSYLFRVKNKNREVIDSCKFQELNIVNYKWLINNSWKENNPNILFKDLYFLIETSRNVFVKYKVQRTVIAN